MRLADASGEHNTTTSSLPGQAERHVSFAISHSQDQSESEVSLADPARSIVAFDAGASTRVVEQQHADEIGESAQKNWHIYDYDSNSEESDVDN